MTERSGASTMQQPSETNAAESHRDPAGGLPVTRPSRSPRIRGLSRLIPSTSAPRPARDIRTSSRFDALATNAGARARRPERLAHRSLDAAVPACAFARGDSRRCMSAGAAAQTAQRSARNQARQCNNVEVAAPSRPAYRRLTDDRGGSFLTSSPGSLLPSVEVVRKSEL